MDIRLQLLVTATVATWLPSQGKIEDFRFDLETLGGRRVTQQDFERNVLIVDFWGTWCPPCRAAIPKLVDLYAKYKHHGLEIVGLNYERGGSPEQQASKVREFAVEQRITYTLALGDSATQQQVPAFSGYPTLLLFRRGLEYDSMHVGFSPGDEKELEKWIRSALELDGAAAEKVAGAPREEKPAEEEPEELGSLDVPEGKIFMPGNGDKGFDFEVEDIDGKTIEMTGLRGKPALIALTASWDKEAAATASLLEEIHTQFEGLQVLAAHLEMPRETAEKIAAIRKFRDEHDLPYRMFPAGLDFTRKIHRFAGIPLILLFDSEGTLILREMGSSADIRARILDRIRALAGG